MKIALLLPLSLALFACAKSPSIVERRCPNSEEPCFAPFSFIAMRPELFEGRMVRVIGYGKSTSTGAYLFETNKQILSPILMPNLSLVDVGSDVTLIERSKIKDQWLDLTGKLLVESDGSRIHWIKLEIHTVRKSLTPEGH